VKIRIVISDCSIIMFQMQIAHETLGKFLFLQRNFWESFNWTIASGICRDVLFHL